MSSNNFMNALSAKNNYTFTENGAVTHKSTLSSIYDMFSLGAAYRQRSDDDVINLFKNALEENPQFALKCLFYIRDVRGGQGERRFFKVCMKWMATQPKYKKYINYLILFIPAIGRWDDLYCFVGTPYEKAALERIANQLRADHKSLLNKAAGKEYEPITLCAKWVKSENTSSVESRELALKTRKVLGWTPKAYRKILSMLRSEINVLEKTLSQGDWATIEFDKIPSKAGIKYAKAFAKNQTTAEKYAKFMADKNNKVNAGTLYPYEIVKEAITCNKENLVRRNTLEKYWDNLTDYFNGAALDALAVVDTSGSMTWGYNGCRPIDVAISIGMYCAEKAKGPFAGHYVSFSSVPQLIKITGSDFVDKIHRIYKTNLCDNTNIEATFDMLLNTAIQSKCTQEDLPKNIIVISDMEFDSAIGLGSRSRFNYYGNIINNETDTNTLMENIRLKWKRAGYEMPHLIYWNVNARNDNIPDLDPDALISYVSGGSPSIFKYILTGKSGIDLMLETLNSNRYAFIDVLFAATSKHERNELKNIATKYVKNL